MATKQRLEISGVLFALIGVLALVAATATGLVQVDLPAVAGSVFGWVRLAAIAGLVAWVFVRRNIE